MFMREKAEKEKAFSFVRLKKNGFNAQGHIERGGKWILKDTSIF